MRPSPLTVTCTLADPDGVQYLHARVSAYSPRTRVSRGVESIIPWMREVAHPRFMVSLRPMDQHSTLAARIARMTFVATALLTGCAHESAPATTTPVSEREQEPTASPETDTAAEPAEPVVEPSVAEEEPPPSPPPAEEPPPPPPPVDMTPAAAPALCAGLVGDLGSLQRSEIKRGGIALPGDARADVVECVYNEPMYGEVVAAYLVIRIAGESEVASEELGQTYDVPGESVTYRLGRIERAGEGVRVRVTLTDTIYPDTGEPGSNRREVDTSRRTVTCAREPDPEFVYYVCERE